MEINNPPAFSLFANTGTRQGQLVRLTCYRSSHCPPPVATKVLFLTLRPREYPGRLLNPSGRRICPAGSLSKISSGGCRAGPGSRFQELFSNHLSCAGICVSRTWAPVTLCCWGLSVDNFLSSGQFGPLRKRRTPPAGQTYPRGHPGTQGPFSIELARFHETCFTLHHSLPLPRGLLALTCPRLLLARQHSFFSCLSFLV